MQQTQDVQPVDTIEPKPLEEVTIVKEGIIRVDVTTPAVTIPEKIETREIDVNALLEFRASLVQRIRIEIPGLLQQLQDTDSDLQKAIDAGDKIALAVDVSSLELSTMKSTNI